MERHSGRKKRMDHSAPNISLLKPDRKTIEVNDGMIALKISNNFCVTRQNKRIIYPGSICPAGSPSAESLSFFLFYKLTFNLRARKRVLWIYIREVAVPSLKSIFTDKWKLAELTSRATLHTSEKFRGKLKFSCLASATKFQLACQKRESRHLDFN